MATPNTQKYATKRGERKERNIYMPLFLYEDNPHWARLTAIVLSPVCRGPHCLRRNVPFGCWFAARNQSSPAAVCCPHDRLSLAAGCCPWRLSAAPTIGCLLPLWSAFPGGYLLPHDRFSLATADSLFMALGGCLQPLYI